MLSSPTKGFVKLLLRRARRDWQNGRTSEDCFADLAAMIRGQLQADHAASIGDADLQQPETDITQHRSP